MSSMSIIFCLLLKYLFYTIQPVPFLISKAATKKTQDGKTQINPQKIFRIQ